MPKRRTAKRQTVKRQTAKSETPIRTVVFQTWKNKVKVLWAWTEDAEAGRRLGLERDGDEWYVLASEFPALMERAKRKNYVLELIDYWATTGPVWFQTDKDEDDLLWAYTTHEKVGKDLRLERDGEEWWVLASGFPALVEKAKEKGYVLRLFDHWATTGEEAEWQRRREIEVRQRQGQPPRPGEPVPRSYSRLPGSEGRLRQKGFGWVDGLWRP